MTVVLNLTGVSHKERLAWEDRLILALKGRGLDVVNNTNAAYFQMRGRRGRKAQMSVAEPFSAERRRKLSEAAKIRWAKARSGL